MSLTKYEPQAGERLVDIDVQISVSGKIWSDANLTNEQMEEGIHGELGQFISTFIMPAPSAEHPYIVKRQAHTVVMVKDSKG